MLVALVSVLVSVTLVEDRVHVRPVEGDIVADRTTVPVNPFSAETVTPILPVAPARSVMLVVSVAREKFGAGVTVTMTDTECVSVPAVPVIVTL